jgi:outer membrane protein OmpA-like peptidoglycan-associated protein
VADASKCTKKQQQRGLPIWAWLLPLLLLAVISYILTRHSASTTTTAAAPAPVAAPVSEYPDLGTVQFDTAKATLTPDSQATLQRAAAIMKTNPNAHLRLEGYTDSTGSMPHKASLSQQRVYAVANFLKGQGIDGSRLTGGGFGPSKPTDSNRRSSGKADNRRVELSSQQ